VLSLQQWP